MYRNIVVINRKTYPITVMAVRGKDTDISLNLTMDNSVILFSEKIANIYSIIHL